MIDLEMTNELVEGTCVVSIAGEIDTFTAPQLQKALLNALDNAPASLIVDLTECDFLDSAALRVLLGARERLDEGGASAGLSIVTPSPTIRKVFEITGLEAMFAFHASRAEAMNGSACLQT